MTLSRHLPFSAVALAAGAATVHVWNAFGPRAALLGLLALALGATLFLASFGFASAYRAFFVARDGRGIQAQLLMLAAATLLFAPLLAYGEAFGQPLGGALAPIGWSVVVGAFLFGVGMQLGDGCASGTLYTVGGGNRKMVLTLAGFLAGSVIATYHMPFWWEVPAFAPLSLGRWLGWGAAVAAQLALIALLALVVAHFTRGPVRRPPRALVAGGLALALLNLAVLATAGHPWSIAWGYTLWGGKVAAALGVDLTATPFWSGGFARAALEGGLLADTTSRMDLGVIVGATLAALLGGRFLPPLGRDWRPLAGALLGGVLMGYGARLAFGCNVGAFFSGVASLSPHGWLWIAAALPGNWLGIHARPWFGLAGFRQPTVA